MIRHIFNFNALSNSVWNTDTVYFSPVGSFSHSVPFTKGVRFVSSIISTTWWFFICVKFSRSTLDYRRNVSLVLCFYLLIYRDCHLLRNAYLSLIEIFLLFILSGSCCRFRCRWFSFFVLFWFNHRLQVNEKLSRSNLVFVACLTRNRRSSLNLFIFLFVG